MSKEKKRKPSWAMWTWLALVQGVFFAMTVTGDGLWDNERWLTVTLDGLLMVAFTVRAQLLWLREHPYEKETRNES